MNEITTVGLDLARNVFQVHAVDATGAVVIRRQARRAQMLLFFSRLTPCLIGMEARAGTHFRSRELAKPGHEVRLTPPSCVRPFVRRGKTDAAHAEAICTAVVQPTMGFVSVRTETQQAVLISHRTRDFLVRQLTQLANAIRARPGEFGLAVPKGVHNMGRLVAEADAADLPPQARMPLELLVGQMVRLEPIFPKCQGRPRVDDRRVLGGMTFINRNVLRWCGASHDHGTPATFHNRWRRWSQMGVCTRMMQGLPANLLLCGHARRNGLVLLWSQNEA